MAVAKYQYYSKEGHVLRCQPLFHVELGPLLHMYLQKYHGRVFMHIRNFTPDITDTALYPTVRGIRCDVQQTADLLHELPTLLEVALGGSTTIPPTAPANSGIIQDDLFGGDGDMDLFSDEVMEEFKVHIGKNLFAVAKRDLEVVDVREFFFTSSNTLQATKRGVYLKREQLEIVAQTLREKLVNIWGGLAGKPPCHTTHKDNAECKHCTPRYITPEEKAIRAQTRREKAQAIFAAAVAVTKKKGPNATAAADPSNKDAGTVGKGTVTQTFEDPPLNVELPFHSVSTASSTSGPDSPRPEREDSPRPQYQPARPNYIPLTREGSQDERNTDGEDEANETSDAYGGKENLPKPMARGALARAPTLPLRKRLLMPKSRPARYGGSSTAASRGREGSLPPVGSNKQAKNPRKRKRDIVMISSSEDEAQDLSISRLEIADKN